jgi:hypothetical protein
MVAYPMALHQLLLFPPRGTNRITPFEHFASRIDQWLRRAKSWQDLCLPASQLQLFPIASSLHRRQYPVPSRRSVSDRWYRVL